MRAIELITICLAEPVAKYLVIWVPARLSKCSSCWGISRRDKFNGSNIRYLHNGSKGKGLLCMSFCHKLHQCSMFQ